ncbi:MAG: carbohydrate kinase [Bacteroidetes bacterium]|nr:MAG: carbohydrate kinase [Bacteroidota bacterium]
MEDPVQYKVVCFGEILWDVLPDKKMPGGAPMNVAYHLNQLEIPTAMISRVGKDALGDEILKFIESKNLSSKYIQYDEEYSTGKVLATLHGNEVSYEILQPVAWDYIRANQNVQDLVSKSEYFIFGSLVARSETSRQTLFQLLEIAPFKILDINLRIPHYDRKVLEYLMQHADLLKLNSAELELISGWYNLMGTEREKMVGIQNKFQLHTIVTTRGEHGAIVLADDNFYEHKGFQVKVADTIGSGDAFLAAFLSKFINSESPEKSIEFASALGAYVATQNGACPNYAKKEIEIFVDQHRKSDYA